MRDNIVAITASEARSAIDASAGLEDRARQAFAAAAKGFLAPTDEEVLMAGCSALLETCDDAERVIVMGEIEVIGHANRVLTAAMTGIPIDWEAMPEAPEKPDGAVGIMALCREAVLGRGY